MRTPAYTRGGLVAVAIGALVLGYCLGAFALSTGRFDLIALTIGPLLGTAIGATIAFWVTSHHDHDRRQREISELQASIYVEIADRAGRCINDYLVPWRDFTVKATNNLNSERVGKFRPTDPVVFPSIAGKLGLFEPEALLAITQFYFRLDHLRQAIESLESYCERRESPGVLPIVGPGDQSRAQLIAIRLKGCLAPGLTALERLDSPRSAQFDAEVTQLYPHLERSGDSLRAALRKHAV